MPTIGTSTGIGSVDIVDSSVTGTDVLDLTLTTADIAAASRLDLRGAYNVKDAAYGAVGDGTTDDRPALAAALTAAASGGVVYLPAGTYLLNTTGPLSLPQLSTTQSLKIVGAGANATTIKLSTTCKRAFDLRRVVDYDTFRNIEISDLTVDANSVASTSNQHVVLGNLRDGSWDQRLNFQNIAVRRVRTINVPAANTDDGSTTGSRQNVSIVSKHLGTGEGTQTTIKDITVEDCDFGDVASAAPSGGGVGVAIMGSGHSSSVNVLIDRILVKGFRHDTGVTPTVPAGASISHVGVQIGGVGMGGSCTLKDCFLRNSNDVGVEIDGMTYASLENVTTEDAWHAGTLLRNFRAPLNASAQTYTLRNCHHRIIGINPPTTSSTAGNSYGWYLSGSGAPTLNSVVMEDCSYLNTAANFLAKGEAIACPELPLKKLTLRNFRAIHETINHSPASTTSSTLIRYAPSVSNTLEIDGLHLSWAGTWGGTASSLAMATFEGAGPTTLSVNDIVFENSIAATGSTIYGVWFGKATGSDNASISGAFRRDRAQSWTTTASSKVFGFVDSPALTIPHEIVIEDADHSGFPSATAVDALHGGTTNVPKIRWVGGALLTRGIPFDKDNGQVGILAPSGHGIYISQSAVALTASRAYLARFRPSRDMVITKIAFNLTTAAGSDDACDVGIYDSTYARVVAAGATSGKLNATAGIQTVTITATALKAGVVYYAAFSCGTFGGTAAQVTMTSLGGTNLVDIFGSTAGLREQTFQASAHPLGSSITSGGGIGNVPLLALRES